MDNDKKIIGFANKYYTLWTYRKTIRYATDAYGKHWPAEEKIHYSFIKNISSDINKVKRLYPDLKIDNELRGKTRNFYVNKDVELPADYFWFGRYNGKKIDDVIKTDFKYCLWALENAYSAKTREYIENHPVYKKYINDIENEKKNLIDAGNTLKDGDVAELYFTTNGRLSDEQYYAMAEYGNTIIEVNFEDGRHVDGLYPYIMPIINGKALRTKNKTIKVKIKSAEPPKVYGNEIYQTVYI